MKYFVQFEQFNNGKLMDILGSDGFAKFDGRLNFDNLTSQIYDRVKKLREVKRINSCKVYKCNELGQMENSRIVYIIENLNVLQNGN